ncbi:MAG TPA: PilT/PilU family type 4a pilus ATPase [Thermoanaerobaculia bacterium]|nr:PilT/PilU family type 4a pilus ATPase [Thermoanaerobaculia bacterium]
MSSSSLDDVNRLIRELNRNQDAPVVGLGQEETRGEDARWIEPILGRMIQLGATYLHLVGGSPAAFRIDGELRFDRETAASSAQIAALVRGRNAATSLAERGSTDFSLSASLGDAGSGYRFRINVHRQRGELAATVRVLPASIPDFAKLNLPPVLAEMARENQGLVLVCGPTGSGKSTTLAAIVDEINRTRAAKIITIEDPIEYEHRNQRSLIEQVEIGRDAPSFAEALRSALRQDPDVILVGEMRDLETISIALTAAETGHLILATRHTSGAAQAIHRIVDAYPATQQGQVFKQVALSLRSIVSQRLVPRAGGRGLVPAVELLQATGSVRNQIRLGRVENLANEITLGKRQGMLTFDDSLADLVRRGLASLEDARARADAPDDFARLVGR